jgi:hypothetical protein
MSDRYYYCNKGAGLAADVSEATSTQASTVELRVTYTSFAEKIDVLKAIDAIKSRIEQGNWKPA